MHQDVMMSFSFVSVYFEINHYLACDVIKAIEAWPIVVSGLRFLVDCRLKFYSATNCVDMRFKFPNNLKNLLSSDRVGNLIVFNLE